MGELAIDPSQRNVTDEDVSNFVVAHENAHGVGPREVGLAQPYRGALEEAKADQEGVASLPLAVANKILTQDQADKAAIAMVYGLLRGLSYGMSDPHGIGSFIEFASLYNEGGIVETKEGLYKTNLANGAIFTAAKKTATRMEQIQVESVKDPAKASKDALTWLEESKAKLPPKMKNEYLAKLEKMPKDVYPWYHFQFSPGVEKDMTAANTAIAEVKKKKEKK